MLVSHQRFLRDRQRTVRIVSVCLTTLISDVTADCLLYTAGGTSAQFSQADIMLEISPLKQQLKSSAQCSNVAELYYRPLDVLLCTGTDNMSAFLQKNQR